MNTGSFFKQCYPSFATRKKLSVSCMWAHAVQKFESYKQICASITLSHTMWKIQCAVPENIHTPSTEGIGISWEVEGYVRPKNLKKCMKLKGTRQLCDRADLNTSFSHFEKSLPQPEIKVHLEIRFIFRTVLLYFQLLTEKPVFECPFAHPMILFLSYLVKKPYLIRLCYMQISYGMVCNVHVCQLTVSL